MYVHNANQLILPDEFFLPFPGMNRLTRPKNGWSVRMPPNETLSIWNIKYSLQGIKWKFIFFWIFYLIKLAREWEKVYDESLQLIRAYPFMGNIDRDYSYGGRWKYVQRADEKNGIGDENPYLR